MRYREIIVGVIVVLLVVLGFIFRENIFRSASKVPQENKTGQVQSAGESATAGDRAATSSPNVNGAPIQGNTPGAVSAPDKAASVYRGRPLEEIRFGSDAHASMSDRHRDQLSADIRKYAKMAKDNPEHIAAWLQTALLKKAIGDYEGARDIWIYLTIVRPKDATAFLNLGDLYTNYLKEYASAERNYRSAIKADPEVTMGYIGLSDLYIFFYKEKANQAEAVLKQGIAANPNDANLAHALSRLYERRAK